MFQAEVIARAEALRQDQYWYAQGAAQRPLNMARSRKGKGQHGRDGSPSNLRGRLEVLAGR